MPEAFLLPEWFRITASMLAALLVVAQAVAFIYSFYRSYAGYSQKLDNVVEAMVLVYSFLLVLLAGNMQTDAHSAPVFFAVVRLLQYVLFGATILAVAVNLLHFRRICALLIVPLEAMPLPLTEQYFPFAFSSLCLLATALLFIRAVVQIVCYHRDTRKKLSYISIKFAIDALHTGILFCRPNGQILLSNTKMQRLMVTLTGSLLRNGREFFDDYLSLGKCLDGCERLPIGNQIAYRLPDESVWLFTKSDISSGRRIFVQLSATDITDQWKMTAELRKQHTMLQSRQNELNRAIADIQSLCHKEEALRIRSRFHDMLGQRIALLLRNLRENREPDEDLLHAFTDGLPQELRESRDVNSPQKRIKTLCRMMSGIGVTVHLQDDLPDNPTVASLFTDIIIEAATNSIRHGFATEVFVRLKQTPEAIALRISDNGIPPHGSITEGGGISGMRQRLMLVGGTLDICTSPQFILSISIPGGKQ